MYFGSCLYISSQIPWEHLEKKTNFPGIRSSPDVFVVSPIEGKLSISIDQVHRLSEQLSYKPVIQPYKIAIIFPADFLTLPAQQALLKTLEEPVENTQIILVTAYPQKLLATIVSRCTQEAHKPPQDSTSIDPTIKALFTQLRSPDTSISTRITLAQTYATNKESALTTLEQLILLQKNELTQPTTTSLALLQKTIVASRMVQANGNARLILESLFFSFL